MITTKMVRVVVMMNITATIRVLALKGDAEAPWKSAYELKMYPGHSNVVGYKTGLHGQKLSHVVEQIVRQPTSVECPRVSSALARTSTWRDVGARARDLTRRTPEPSMICGAH
jgi:hypothetical protein